MQWMFVGIMEAHASDLWPLAFSFEQKECTNVEERCSRATALCAELFPTSPGLPGWRVMADTMDNSFHSALGAWPTNYYVMRSDGALMFVADDGSDDDGTACAARLRGLLTGLRS